MPTSPKSILRNSMVSSKNSSHKTLKSVTIKIDSDKKLL